MIHIDIKLHVCIFQVITFFFPPTVMYWETQGGGGKQWFGNNIRLVEAVARVLNFTFTYKEPPPGECHSVLYLILL